MDERPRVSPSVVAQVFFGELEERHWVPREIIRRMLEAMEEGPLLDSAEPFEVRLEMWQHEYERLDRFKREQGGPWAATTITFVGS